MCLLSGAVGLCVYVVDGCVLPGASAVAVVGMVIDVIMIFIFLFVCYYFFMLVGGL